MLKAENLTAKSSHNDLPDDTQALKEMVLTLLGQIDDLSGQLHYLKRQMFGKKSEKLNANQRLLFEDLYDQIEQKLKVQEQEEEIEVVKRKKRPIPIIMVEGLLSHIITSKYCDHLPLNRLENIFQRHGIYVSVSSMADWVGNCSDLLEALVDRMRENILNSPKIHTDDTTVHWYRNVFSKVPRQKVREVAAMLKAIHAQEDKKAAEEKARQVIEKLISMRLKEAAKVVEDGYLETMSYYNFPDEHWTRLRTNNGLERIMKEIRRRTRVVGSFPDGHSALMLATARLRHIAGTKWSSKRYLNMEHLYDLEKEQKIMNKKTG